MPRLPLCVYCGKDLKNGKKPVKYDATKKTCVRCTRRQNRHLAEKSKYEEEVKYLKYDQKTRECKVCGNRWLLTRFRMISRAVNGNKAYYAQSCRLCDTAANVAMKKVRGETKFKKKYTRGYCLMITKLINMGVSEDEISANVGIKTDDIKTMREYKMIPGVPKVVAAESGECVVAPPGVCDRDLSTDWETECEM